MDEFSFRNLKFPQHTTPGIAEKVLIALVEWFVEPGGIKGPGVWVVPGDDVLIKDSHQFKDGFAFIELSLAPEKNSYNAKNIGDTGFQKFANEINVFVPGSYAEEHELIKDLLNQPVIVLVRDSDCPANMYYQVGTGCVSAYVSPTFATGTTKEGVKGYVLNISNTAEKVFLYQGVINYTEDRIPLVARLDGSISGTTVNLDASDSDIYGDMTYEYTVYYNDNADMPQSVVLPDGVDHATFDTSILINWNNAGFAVKLKITNLYESDTTHTSDGVGNRPYIAGAVDESFDESFDFNITL